MQANSVERLFWRYSPNFRTKRQIKRYKITWLIFCLKFMNNASLGMKKLIQNSGQYHVFVRSKQSFSAISTIGLSNSGHGQ